MIIGPSHSNFRYFSMISVYFSSRGLCPSSSCCIIVISHYGTQHMPGSAGVGERGMGTWSDSVADLAPQALRVSVCDSAAPSGCSGEPPAQCLRDSEGSRLVSRPVPWLVSGALRSGALPRFQISMLTPQATGWRWRKCRRSVWLRQSPHHWKLLMSRTNPQNTGMSLSF